MLVRVSQGSDCWEMENTGLSVAMGITMSTNINMNTSMLRKKFSEALVTSYSVDTGANANGTGSLEIE